MTGHNVPFVAIVIMNKSLAFYMVLGLVVSGLHSVAQSTFERQDFRVNNGAGMKVHLRRIAPATYSDSIPVLMLHGGGGNSIAAYDTGVPGYSLAEDLAAAGRVVYLLNLRGWGESDWPKEMDAPPENNPALVTTEDAVTDIEAAARWICEEEKASNVSLFGWASGGHWLACFTSRHNALVNKLIVLNTLYAVDAPWKIGEGSDPEQTAAYRIVDAVGLTRRWEASVAPAQKKMWWDDRVIHAYQLHSIQGDPSGLQRNPPSVRIPLGYWKEHLQMSKGEKFYDASDIRVPVLVIRGGKDFWSRPEDLVAFREALSGNSSAMFREIPEGTHFLFFDKPEKGRSEFLQAVLQFLEP
jgi:pimeloyl-ACP methyl ester carboxylesterase